MGQLKTDHPEIKTRLAAVISVIGHPLLTLSVFTIVALFTQEEFNLAWKHAVLILAGFFLPVALKMYLNSRNGAYTNFDVSDKKQRQSWYVFAFFILLTVTILLFITDQPRALRMAVLLSLVLLTVSLLTNYFIKSSLHVSSTIFLSFLIMPMNFLIGLCLLTFTIPIAWSRLVLKNHTVSEIIAGSLIGLVVGVCYWFLA